jgi:programmed cell death protein 5
MSGENTMSVQQAQQLEQMKRQLLANMLTKEAFERLGRVRTVNPGLAGQAELYLLQLYQAGRLKQKISDGKMREVLNVLSGKKGFNIKRK